MSTSRLHCILLIDDDETTNYFHKTIVNNSGFVDKCVIAENGLEALELLQSDKEGNFLQPDLIFLDINMPKMNGWEFLEEYKKLNASQRDKMVLIMLSTSINPADREKAKTYDAINDFISKPLTLEAIDSIISTHCENPDTNK